MSEAPRFEADLRAIREARSVSLTDLNRDTRIPVDMIERLERGELVGDPAFNEVYLRNLVRSYAEAVSLPAAEVLTAFEAQKAGTYSGSLRVHLGDAPPPVAPPPKAAEPKEPKAPPQPSAPPPPPGTAPAVHALEQAKAEPTKKKKAPKPAKAAPPQRLRPEGGPATPLDRSWGVIIGGTLVGLLVIGGLLWFLLRSDDPDVIERPRPAQVAEDTTDAATDTTAVAQATPPPSDAPRLQTPIQVTIVAQDGALQNFRVTAAPDVRRPMWLEQGETQSFSSDTEVIVWGTESGGSFGIPQNARVQLQGYTWQPTGQVLRITPERGQALLDSLHRAQGAPTGG